MSSGENSEEGRSRRSFFGILVGSISVIVGVIMAIPLARFSLYPLFHPAGGAEWFPLGSPDQFNGNDPIRAEVEVRKVEGWRVNVVKQTVWVTRDANGRLRVLSAVCPHLGCTIPWNAGERLFVCPCHKGFFKPDGALVSGPPPRGLDSLPTKLENGQLWVKYQYYQQLTPNRQVIG